MAERSCTAGGEATNGCFRCLAAALLLTLFAGCSSYREVAPETIDRGRTDEIGGYTRDLRIGDHVRLTRTDGAVITGEVTSWDGRHLVIVIDGDDGADPAIRSVAIDEVAKLEKRRPDTGVEFVAIIGTFLALVALVAATYDPW